MSYKQQVLNYLMDSTEWKTEADIMRNFNRYKHGNPKYLGDWGTTNKYLHELIKEGKVFRMEMYDSKINRKCYHYRTTEQMKVTTTTTKSEAAADDVLKDLYNAIKYLDKKQLTEMRAQSDLVDRALEKYDVPVAIKLDADGMNINAREYGNPLFIGKYYAKEIDRERIIFINTKEFDYEFIPNYQIGNRDETLPALKFFKKKS